MGYHEHVSGDNSILMALIEEKIDAKGEVGRTCPFGQLYSPIERS